MTPQESKIIQKARKIALRDLRLNYGRLGIYAGPKHFREYWARDGFFATFGACRLKDFQIVRKNLDLFVKYQGTDGQIPLRVEEKSHGLSLLGINFPYKSPRPAYNSSQIWADKALDPTMLFVVGACFYVKSSGDAKWFSDNEASLTKALGWVLKRRDKKGLVKEGLVANWADMTSKSGHVTYTNVCLWKALKDFSEIKPEYQAETESLKAAINRELWSQEKGYYLDWIGDNGHRYDDFFADGNILAVVWGLADSLQAEKIYSFIEKNRLNIIPVTLCFPRLPLPMDIFIRIITPFYHTKNIFAWWGPWEILGKAVMGDKKGAKRDLIRLSEVVGRNGAFIETLYPQGAPADVFWYKVERGVAWGAGIFLYVLEELERKEII